MGCALSLRGILPAKSRQVASHLHEQAREAISARFWRLALLTACEPLADVLPPRPGGAITYGARGRRGRLCANGRPRLGDSPRKPTARRWRTGRADPGTKAGPEEFRSAERWCRAPETGVRSPATLSPGTAGSSAPDSSPPARRAGVRGDSLLEDAALAVPVRVRVGGRAPSGRFADVAPPPAVTAAFPGV